MGDAYSWEIRENAEELYIINGLTYDLVAEHTGVSVSQLKRWGAEGEQRERRWKERRRAYRKAQTTIRESVQTAKVKLIESVVKSEDPQKAYAFSRLVKVSLSIEKVAAERRLAERPAIGAGVTRIIKTPKDAVEALQEAVQKKINAMLSEPGGVSLAVIRDTKQAMEMVEQLKAKYSPDAEDDNKPGGLSDEAASVIRKQILGMDS